MVRDWLKDLIEERFTDDVRVSLFGLGEGNEERVKNYITQVYRPVGGSDDISDRELDEHIKDLKRTTPLNQAIALAGFTTNIRLSERFRFSNLPGVQAAAKTIDGYGEVVGNILQTREQILYEYSQMIRYGVLGGAAAAIQARPVIRAIMQLPATVRRARRAIAVARASGSIARGAVAWGGRAGKAVGSLGGPKGFVASVAVFAALDALINTAINRYILLLDERATRLAVQAHAREILDSDRLSMEYAQYRITPLMREDPEMVYENMRSIIDNTRGGISPFMFGYNYQEVSETLNILTRTGIITQDEYQELAARTLQMSGLFGVDAVDTFATLTRISGARDEEGFFRFGADVDITSELFEQFFSSLVVDGQLQVSQLQLIDSLAAFSESYVLGRRFNIEDGPTNLARIHQYLSPTFGYRQTTAVTEQLVTGIDDVLTSGAVGMNPHVQNIMARTGITAGEAFMGITSSPDVLERFLYGIYLSLGIGIDAFDEEGNLSDDDMQRFMAYTSHGLNMDLGTSRGVYAAYRSFVGGARGEDVNTAYHDELVESMSDGLDETAWVELTKKWTEGSLVLSEIVFSYGHLLIALDEQIMNLSKLIVPELMDEIEERIETAIDVMEGREGGSIFRRFSRLVRGIVSPESLARPSNILASRHESVREAMEYMRDEGYRYLDPADALEDYETLAQRLVTIRHYNPGALMYAGQANAVRAEGGRWAHFGSMEAGFQAMINQLALYATGESRLTEPGQKITLDDAVRMWAPVGDEQSESQVSNYVNFIVNYLRSKGINITKDTLLTDIISNPASFFYMGLAMSYVEMGQNIARQLIVYPEERSIGGQVGGASPYIPQNMENEEINSNIVPEYVNIDIELNGEDAVDFARYFQSSFMRA